LLVGAAALVGSSSAMAAPINGSAIKEAAEQIGIGESVHCRSWRHWSPRWGWHRGCRGATIYYDSGPRYRYGYRYGHRYGYGGGFRGGVDVRTRSGTVSRGDFRGGATIRDGQAGTVSPRGPAGGQFRGGAQMGGGGGGQGGAAVSGGGGGGRGMGGGGQMRSAPTGAGGGGAAMGGGGGGRGQGGGGGHDKQ